MGKLDIVRAGHPVLRGVAEAVTAEELGQKPLQKLVRTMVEAMRRAPGVGLAAPQIGVPKRVIVLEDAERLMANLSPEQRVSRGRVPFALRAIVNPTIELAGDATATFFEGCLSVPGYSALVERHLEVVVRGVDERGGPIEWRATGWPARILQHELDHLEGVLYVDRMMPRTFGVNEEIGARWLALSASEVREKLRA